MLPVFLLGFVQATSDRSQLVEGVDSLIAPGALPGPVVASKSAFVVLRTGDAPTVSAGPVGAGRAMVAGHGGFFNKDSLLNPSNSRFFINTLSWLGKRPARGLRVGLLGFDGISSAVQGQGASTVNIDRQRLSRSLQEVDVLFMEQNALDGDDTSQRIVVSWIKTGHGLFTAGPAWGWQQLNPAKNLRTDMSANRMLLPYGLGLSGDYADGSPVAQGSDDPLLQTDTALATLRKGGLTPAESARATGAVSRMLSLSPLDDKGLMAEIARLAGTEDGKKWPVGATMPFSRIYGVIKHRTWEAAAPEKVKADPSAVFFPGPVPKGAKRISRTVPIDTKIPDWHGLGLYAAPGEVVEVTIPEIARNKGVGVRIGSHTDTLWEAAEWQRFPEISRRWPLDTSKTKIASPFGGTVFIDVPAGSSLGSISVTVKGAVPAPRYVRGKTTLAEWKRMVAEPGGPWVELEANAIILSVPRSAIANLKDPETLMAYWDETADLCYKLYAAPRRPRAERYCVDRQISNGYMHAGYPIMTWEDVATTFTDVKKLRGNETPWGFYHELGHNFQEPTWTFEGTGEVTNNLFSLYASEKLNGIPHPGGMNLKERNERTRNYLAKGAPYSEWIADPFLALGMYDQIRDAFGWEPFTEVFANYRRLKLQPAEGIAQRDEWMVQISKATGRNLGPFFTAWGVPTSEEARKSIADLPGWMPEGMPQK